MGKKKHHEAIESYLYQIKIHEEKIEEELAKDVPNENRISHWQIEIETFKLNIQKKAKRL